VNDAENMALATASHAALIIKTRMPDRGLKRARFVVIRDVTIPGVLLEGGFQSNPFDAKMIATPLYRQTLAQAILQAVENYKRAVGAPAMMAPISRAEPVPTPLPIKETPKPEPAKPEPIDPPKAQNAAEPVPKSDSPEPGVAQPAAPVTTPPAPAVETPASAPAGGR
jgi:N-acetylmuramoyl-L-alanine amidase